MTGSPAGGSAPPDLLLRAAAVVTPDRVLSPGWVAIGGERIVAVGSGDVPLASVPTVADLGDAVLVPGFIDQHVHGGGGAFVGEGPAAAVAAASFHRGHGTTTMIGSLVTDTPDRLRDQVASLVDVCRDGVLAGIHLEGPWLSAARCGAHDPDLLRDPDPAELRSLLTLGQGQVRMVTLAPERSGGLDAISLLAGEGVIAAVGHTDARYEVVRDAIEHGATVATHLFNAMPALHHRRPGPIAALLEGPDTVVEVIADGVHVHESVIRLIVSDAGPDRVALVTDAIAAAGAGDGDLRLGPLAVRVRDGVARLHPGGALAGSTLTMDAAFRRVALLTGDIVAAARMASTTPARVLGLAGDRGALAPGLRADLVALDPQLAVRRVMLAGRWEPPVV